MYLVQAKHAEEAQFAWDTTALATIPGDKAFSPLEEPTPFAEANIHLYHWAGTQRQIG